MLHRVRKYANALEMHLHFGGKAPSIPTIVWVIFTQCILTFMFPVVFPELREQEMFILSWWMLVVNIIGAIILLAFAVRLSVNTFQMDQKRKQQLASAFALGTGDISLIESQMAKPDVLILQHVGEPADEYKKRLEAAKLNATTAVWVVTLVKGSPFGVIYIDTMGSGMAIDRRVLPWEVEKTPEERSVSADYNFLTEDDERFALYAARFVQEWPAWAIVRKPQILQESDPHAALNVIIEQTK